MHHKFTPEQINDIRDAMADEDVQARLVEKMAIYDQGPMPEKMLYASPQAFARYQRIASDMSKMLLDAAFGPVDGDASVKAGK